MSSRPLSKKPRAYQKRVDPTPTKSDGPGTPIDPITAWKKMTDHERYLFEQTWPTFAEHMKWLISRRDRTVGRDSDRRIA